MKFTNLVALIAIVAFAASANAYSDGTLRRGTDVAQNDSTTTTSSKEVNININTNSAQAQQQPTTVVEAAPVTESKAEGLRKARQEAEVSTEQKIVEKLEDSRLQEERARADRLFGNKLDAQPAPVAVAPAPQPVPVAAPVIVQEKPVQPAQVTIEKVEIIEPAKKEQKAEPVAESKMEEPKEEKAPESTSRYYVSGLAGNMSYQASNVKSNYGLGVAVGTIIDERYAIELSYLYSNHDVGDLWYGDLYHKLDQTDLTASAKYYILQGKLKPYVGGSLSYINRKYTDLSYYNSGYNYGYNTSQTTQAMDAGILAGVDFEINKSFIIGGGVDYNFNVMNFNNMNYSGAYLPQGAVQLEKINFYTMLVTAKFVF